MVRSVQEEVPAELEKGLRAAAASRPFARSWPWSRVRWGARPGPRFPWPVLVPAAAAVCALAAALLVPALRQAPQPQVTEIRTEFELSDKNIKIVFFQRPDFRLYEED